MEEKDKEGEPGKEVHMFDLLWPTFFVLSCPCYCKNDIAVTNNSVGRVCLSFELIWKIVLETQEKKLWAKLAKLAQGDNSICNRFQSRWVQNSCGDWNHEYFSQIEQF